MKFFFLIVSLSVFSFAQAADTNYVVLRDLVSADREGPHRGIAQHVIGFKNGSLVPEYLAACSFTFRPGNLAQLAQGEKLKTTEPFTIRTLQRENCLHWGTTNGGDDFCERYGEPFQDQILTGVLERLSGEKLRVFCNAKGQTDPRSAELLWVSAVRGLLLSQP